MEHLDQPVRGAWQQAGLTETEDRKQQAPGDGQRHQAGVHVAYRGQDGQHPQCQYEHHADQHVDRDQAQRITRPEQTAQDQHDRSKQPHQHLGDRDRRPHVRSLFSTSRVWARAVYNASQRCHRTVNLGSRRMDRQRSLRR